MKDFKKFEKEYKKCGFKDEQIKRIYKDYCDIEFRFWLWKFSYEQVQRIGENILREIWETLSIEER